MVKPTKHKTRAGSIAARDLIAQLKGEYERLQAERDRRNHPYYRAHDAVHGAPQAVTA